MLIALRVNGFCRGHSGVCPENVRKFLAMCNKNCLSYVPCQGTVGASGDLAPLAHLTLGLLGYFCHHCRALLWLAELNFHLLSLISAFCRPQGGLGEGKMWDTANNCWAPAIDILKRAGIEPMQLHAKEGLAMINGTAFITTFAGLLHCGLPRPLSSPIEEVAARRTFGCDVCMGGGSE